MKTFLQENLDAGLNLAGKALRLAHGIERELVRGTSAEQRWRD